jgi:glycosyltransferase involved in cell wall biosynthesis
MKFLLFGTGDYYERYKKWFNKGDVVALLDNSPSKQNTLIDGIKVLSPKDGIELEYDCIVILSFYVKAMRRQLEELGVPSDMVYHFYDLHKLIYSKEIKKPIEYYGASRDELMSDKGQKILLLSQDMTLGGPAIALYHVAEVLKNNGYNVVFATMIDGPLKDRLLDMGIPVIVDVNLQIETMEDAEWVNGFGAVFCNAINFCVFLSKRNTKMKYVWWLHDSEFFYDGIPKEVFKSIVKENLYVYSVGNVPREAITKHIPQLEVGNLIYGVKDGYVSKGEKLKNNKVIFATVGYIEARKGQDVLIKAVRMLPVEMRENSEFYLVGQDSSMLARQIKDDTSDMPEVIMTGVLDREGVNKILEMADVMVCPSREDPMPTVAAEAMMHSVPCVLSNATGTALYIDEGVNGMVFESENAGELADRLEWCITHRRRLKQMGEKARKIYEGNFSMKIFEKNLIECMDGVFAR